MTKKSTYLILLFLFFGVTAFVVLKHNGKLKNRNVAFYPLQERTGALALLPEWASTKANGNKLIQIVRETPTDIKSTLALAALYIQEARVTGNYSYYDAAAMKYIEDVLAQEPQNFNALVLKAILQLSQHHFSEALETAAVAQKINPYNAFIYGIMVDGNVEMGNYATAVENCDKMISIRPDIRSYSRVSYLREIHGDYAGAIEAMKMAVEAGGTGDEATEWCRIQLAHLYENTGDLRSAEMHYIVALNERPGYGYALAGLGQVAMARKNYAAAISLHQQADSAFNDYALKEQLAELYIITGQQQKAASAINGIINQLTRAAEAGEQSINHHADKELAYVYLLKKQPAKALYHALAEYNRRPNNIDANEAVAWAYYKNNDATAALPYLKAALKTNCKNPVLLTHAGLIFVKAGKPLEGKKYLQAAQVQNPNISLLLKQEAEQVLKTL